MEKPTNTPPIPSWDLLEESHSTPRPPVTEIHKGHDDGGEHAEHDDGDERAEHDDGDKRGERDADRDH